MKVRFQADADLNQIILLATMRNEPAIDFQTALAAGLASMSDGEVLALAATEGRVLVTHDRKTMPRHFSESITTEMSAGLLVVSQYLPTASVVDDLILIWLATEAEEWTNRISYLPLV